MNLLPRNCLGKGEEVKRLTKIYKVGGSSYKTARSLADAFGIGITTARTWIKKRRTKCGQTIRVEETTGY